MDGLKWAVCNDPVAMLRFVRRLAFPPDELARKMCLFSCACYRGSPAWGSGAAWQRHTEEVERLLEDGAFMDDRRRSASVLDGCYAAIKDPVDAALVTAGTWGGAETAGRKCWLARCLWGPFEHPLPLGGPGADVLAWNGGAVPLMAALAYRGHQFDLLPALADALEDAGCTHTEALMHLRGHAPCWVCLAAGGYKSGAVCSPGFGLTCASGWVRCDLPHARGCRVLDWILGKRWCRR